MTWLRVVGAALALQLTIAATAFAADNTATGDVAGERGGISPTQTRSALSTTVLALTKTAFLSDGTPLTSGDTLASGTMVKFMVYVDNPTDARRCSTSTSRTSWSRRSATRRERSRWTTR